MAATEKNTKKRRRQQIVFRKNFLERLAWNLLHFQVGKGLIFDLKKRFMVRK